MTMTPFKPGTRRERDDTMTDNIKPPVVVNPSVFAPIWPSSELAITLHQPQPTIEQEMKAADEKPIVELTEAQRELEITILSGEIFEAYEVLVTLEENCAYVNKQVNDLRQNIAASRETLKKISRKAECVGCEVGM